MEKEFNYSILFKQAIQRIKCIRNPHAANPEFTDMKWDDVRNELLFDFGGNEHEKYERVITSAKDISLSCLHFIILKLGEIYGCQFKTIDAEIKIDKGSKIYFATVYKGNIIKNLIMDCQSYTKYRPNETTGGIFVSWRRKEELPTGA